MAGCSEYGNKALCYINSKELLNELNDYQRSKRSELHAVYYKLVFHVRFDIYRYIRYMHEADRSGRAV